MIKKKKISCHIKFVIYMKIIIITLSYIVFSMQHALIMVIQQYRQKSVFILKAQLFSSKQYTFYRGKLKALQFFLISPLFPTQTSTLDNFIMAFAKLCIRLSSSAAKRETKSLENGSKASC